MNCPPGVTVPSESRGVEVTVQRGGKRRASEEVQPHGLQLTQGPQSVRREDVCALMQDELHHLVLEHHGHGHAGLFRLRPQQRGPEHYGYILHRHTVLLAVLDHPAVGSVGSRG